MNWRSITACTANENASRPIQGRYPCQAWISPRRPCLWVVTSVEQLSWNFEHIPVNKQLNDKERVAAALDNPALLNVVEKCLSTAWEGGFQLMYSQGYYSSQGCTTRQLCNYRYNQMAHFYSMIYRPDKLAMTSPPVLLVVAVSRILPAKSVKIRLHKSWYLLQRIHVLHLEFLWKSL